MRRLLMVLLGCAALAAAAATVDGTWKADLGAAQKKAGKRGNAPQAASVIFDLKNVDGKLTGTVTSSAGKRGRSMTIQDGKLEGDRFSFTSVQRTKKGEQKWAWSGTVTDGQLTGTRRRDGARRGQSFTAKRQ